MTRSLNGIYRMFLCVAFLFSLATCSGKKDTKVDKYFNLPQFIDQQVRMLWESQPQMTKVVMFGDDTETTVITDLDSAQWEKELKIFMEHDINKPVLVDAYQVKESTDQGQKQISYQLKNTDEMGILKLEVQYEDSETVSGLNSTFSEATLLYGNFREVSLTTQEDGRLSAYRVVGFHKLMFKDTVRYKLDVKLDYNQ